MMLLTRYFMREVLNTVLVVAGVLFMLFLSHLSTGYFNQLSLGLLSLLSILRLIVLQTPILLSIILPLGLYLGILLAYGRLYTDNEMTISFASGVSHVRLICVTLASATVVLLIVGVVMLWLKPHLYWAQHQVIMHNPLQSVVPGKFALLEDGNTVVYAEGGDTLGHLKHVFIVRRNENQIIIAASAYTTKGHKKNHDSKMQGHFITFNNGMRYNITPGRPVVEVTGYREYNQRLPSAFMMNASSTRLDSAQRVKYLPTSMLWSMAAHNQFAAAELQWRLAVPLSVLILTLLAIPLSHTAPRKGRYAKLLPAILLYIGYMDMLLIARAWTKKGFISSVIGLWWVHGIMVLLLFGFYLFYFYLNRRVTVSC